MSNKQAAKIVTLNTFSELPESVSVSNPNITYAILLTYKYITHYCKDDNGKVIPNYGGALASYPREMGFKLDRSSLMKEARK